LDVICDFKGLIKNEFFIVTTFKFASHHMFLPQSPSIVARTKFELGAVPDNSLFAPPEAEAELKLSFGAAGVGVAERNCANWRALN
jgi:hypothetical protein